jgi:hypothetical protein
MLKHRLEQDDGFAHVRRQHCVQVRADRGMRGLDVITSGAHDERDVFRAEPRAVFNCSVRMGVVRGDDESACSGLHNLCPGRISRVGAQQLHSPLPNNIDTIELDVRSRQRKRQEGVWPPAPHHRLGHTVTHPPGQAAHEHRNLGRSRSRRAAHLPALQRSSGATCPAQRQRQLRSEWSPTAACEAKARPHNSEKAALLFKPATDHRRRPGGWDSTCWEEHGEEGKLTENCSASLFMTTESLLVVGHYM